MLDKRYNPEDFEEQMYEKSKETFSPKGTGQKFSIIMPPPNITGVLHIGHALTYTLQDIIVRYKRLKGFDVLWQPGTDHAGIATQIVVLKQLGKTKENITKEEFLEEAWKWKDYSQQKIIEQQKTLAISPAWEKSRFTLEKNINKTVNKVFVKLYKDGLIYRAEKLVNWDFKLGSALSDLEVVNKETKDKLYYIKYKLTDSNNSLCIATTRPETIFADVALAVHPNDERYQQFIGKKVLIPLCGREIPVIADEFSDPEKGSGIVKITPAHDFNDFEVGKRHNLKIINLLNDNGLLNEQTIPPLQNKKCEEARKIIGSILNDFNSLEKIENITHTVPFSERTGERIEPRLTKQWFCNMDTLAKAAMKVAKTKELKFIPSQWENTYKNWLENIEPWCISRQIWWGHQIPAWYGPDNQVFVTETEKEAYDEAKKIYKQNNFELKQDQDVLDTWFSSALWPFSSLGWPEQTHDLQKYFPTNLLITGFDIIFFWVARMVMMSIYCTQKVPFQDVYIHALVRDEKGQKMSKSKGNIIDPLKLINKFGTDALRLTLCALSVPGRDINISEKIIENYRNFITKLWNAGRFLQMNQCLSDENINIKNIKHPFNHWIILKFKDMIHNIEEQFSVYRYDLIVKELHQFFWNHFCDIYLEGLKPLIKNEEFSEETKQVSIWLYKHILSALHPIIPLVTQKLYEEFSLKNTVIKWPNIDEINFPEPKDINYLLKIILNTRSMKGLLNLQNTLTFGVKKDQNKLVHCIEKYKNILFHFLKTQEIKTISNAENGIPIIIEDNCLYILLENKTKHCEAKEILNKKLNTTINDMEKIELLLNNNEFQKLKPDLFKEKQIKYEKFEEQKKKMETTLNLLS